jgi:hypothetical protein
VSHNQQHPYFLRTTKHVRSRTNVRRLRRAAFASVLATAFALVALAIAPSAAACPDCALGRQMRSELWHDQFLYNFTLAALPFLLIGALCVCAEAIGRTRNAPNEGHASASRQPRNLPPRSSYRST